MYSMDERLNMLDDAAEKIREAIELITDATSDTNHASNVNAYTIAHLRNWCDGVNPYDSTIPKIKEWIEEDGDGPDDYGTCPRCGAEDVDLKDETCFGGCEGIDHD